MSNKRRMRCPPRNYAERTSRLLLLAIAMVYMIPSRGLTQHSNPLSMRYQQSTNELVKRKARTNESQQHNRRDMFTPLSLRMSEEPWDKDVKNRQLDETGSTDTAPKGNKGKDTVTDSMNKLFKFPHKLPPIQIEDVNVLFYDVFLIVNMVLSISFWVVHRMDFSYLDEALSEGSLLSIFWIGAGLYHGSFLSSAVDGHYGSTDERGGPKAAGYLAINTFMNTVSLRLLFALATAYMEHRPVGAGISDQFLPLEIGCGFILMTCWRGLHSWYTPRY